MANLWKPWGPSRARVGDVVIVTFLLAQVLDGALTYLGLLTYGPGAEGNPLIAAMMRNFGHVGGLMTAKAVAAALGAALHIRQVHGIVAALTGLYIIAAIAPWTALLYWS